MLIDTRADPDNPVEGDVWETEVDTPSGQTGTWYEARKRFILSGYSSSLSTYPATARTLMFGPNTSSQYKYESDGTLSVRCYEIYYSEGHTSAHYVISNMSIPYWMQELFFK